MAACTYYRAPARSCTPDPTQRGPGRPPVEFGEEKPQDPKEERRDEISTAVWQAVRTGGGITTQQVADKIGRPKTTVANYLKYLHRKKVNMIEFRDNKWYPVEQYEVDINPNRRPPVRKNQHATAGKAGAQ